MFNFIVDFFVNRYKKKLEKNVFKTVETPPPSSTNKLLKKETPKKEEWWFANKDKVDKKNIEPEPPADTFNSRDYAEYIAEN